MSFDMTTYMRERRRTHPEVREYNRQYAKSYRIANPLKVKEANKKWVEMHKDERREYMINWRENNKEHLANYERNRPNLKEHNKVNSSRRRSKSLGELSIRTIQLVYEDNIKRYGTLTCVYCLLPIQFHNDTLEHRLPLARGGTHEYNNLAIACKKCNFKKNKKTEQEFMDWRK